MSKKLLYYVFFNKCFTIKLFQNKINDAKK